MSKGAPTEGRGPFDPSQLASGRRLSITEALRGHRGGRGSLLHRADRARVLRMLLRRAAHQPEPVEAATCLCLVAVPPQAEDHRLVVDGQPAAGVELQRKLPAFLQDHARLALGLERRDAGRLVDPARAFGDQLAAGDCNDLEWVDKALRENKDKIARLTDRVRFLRKVADAHSAAIAGAEVAWRRN